MGIEIPLGSRDQVMTASMHAIRVTEVSRRVQRSGEASELARRLVEDNRWDNTQL